MEILHLLVGKVTMVELVAELQSFLRQRFTSLELIKLLEDLEEVIICLLEDLDQSTFRIRGIYK